MTKVCLDFNVRLFIPLAKWQHLGTPKKGAPFVASGRYDANARSAQLGNAPTPGSFLNGTFGILKVDLYVDNVERR